MAARENEAQKKRRCNWNEKDRLRNFMEATKYNAIFICNCCHRRLFHETVEIITQKLRMIINAKKNGLIEKCLEERIETPINGNHESWVVAGEGQNRPAVGYNRWENKKIKG